MQEKPLHAILFLVFVTLSVFLGLSFFQMPIDIDESWLGEQVYFLSKLGHVKSILFEGLLQYEKRMLVFHKGFIFIGAFFSAVFGFGLFPLRIVSLVFGLALLGIMYLYLKSINKKSLWPWAALVLLLCPLFFRHLKFYRPEIMLATIGFLSFLFLHYFFQSNSKKDLVLSGIFAGLSVVVHLNGLIFLGAGSGTLLFRRRISSFLFFLLAGILFSLLYFLDVPPDWELFWYQFKNEPSGAGVNLVWYQAILNLLDEHKRLFRKPEIIGIMALFLFGCLIGKRVLKRKPSSTEQLLLSYTVMLIVFLGLIAHSKTTKYAIPLFPFFSIIAVENFALALSEKKALSKKIKIGLFFLFFCYAGYGLVYALSLKGPAPRETTKSNNAVARIIPAGARTLAPMSFIFGEPREQIVVGIHGVRMISRNRGEKWNVKILCKTAKENGFDYVVLDSVHRKELCSTPQTDCFDCPGFSLVFKEGELELFKRFAS